MTKQECAIVEAYTGICMLSGENRKFFYRYVDKLFGRPVYTHEQLGLMDEIKKRAAPDFLRLCMESVDAETRKRGGNGI